MSHNHHDLKLSVKAHGVEVEICESGYTYNSVDGQLRKDLDNAVENVIKIIKAKAEGENT